jgi:hypothetical protein
VITENFGGQHTILLCIGPAGPGGPPNTFQGCYPVLGRPGTDTFFNVVPEGTPSAVGRIFPNTLSIDIYYNANFPQDPGPTPVNVTITYTTQ